MQRLPAARAVSFGIQGCLGLGPGLQFHHQVVEGLCAETPHPCPSGQRRVSQYRSISGGQGQVFREIVAELLEERDALKTSPDDIIFFDDSTLATSCALEVLGGDGDGGAVLVPFPGFPSTYLASASAGKQPIPYFLDATLSWDVTIETLETLRKLIAKQGGHAIQVLALQNPGPAGQLLSAKCLQRCLEFAAEQGLGVLIQEDDSLIHGRDFVHCRQVAQKMKSDVRIVTCVAMQEFSEQVGEEIGAFLQLQNVQLPPDLLSSRKAVPSLRSQAWISSLLSGIPVDSLVYTPAREHENHIRTALSVNAAKARSVFNDVSGMFCAETVAGAHVFPQITVKGFLMKKAISLGHPADAVYSSELLERTGITSEPGSCFGQRPGTFHFRLPVLQSSNSFEEILEKVQKFHVEHPDGWFQ